MDGVGERDDFDSFFSAHYAGALRLAALLLGSPSVAEDVVCDVFTRMYPAYRRGRIENSGPYLRRAVVNAVVGVQRRERTRRRLGPGGRADADVGASQDIAGEVALRDETWTALRRLPAGQRRVLVLRYFEDLSERETARLLHVSVGTVKSQAARGLAALAEMLEGDRGRD